MNADGKVVILITAGRNIRDGKPIERILKQCVHVYSAENIILRHGNARGGDSYARFIARRLKITVQDRPVEYYGLSWKQGLYIGNVRNEKMLDETPIPSIVLAFPDNDSRGTYNCIDAALDRDIPVKMYCDYLSQHNASRIKYMDIICE